MGNNLRLGLLEERILQPPIIGGAIFFIGSVSAISKLEVNIYNSKNVRKNTDYFKILT